MNYRQMQGVTGLRMKPNYAAEAEARAAYLPAMKSAEYTRAANDRALDLTEQGNANTKAYYDKSLDIQQDTLDAQKKDWKRGLMIQGGVLGVNAYNALDDAGAIDKGVSVARGLIGESPETVTTMGDSLSGFAGQSANAQMPGSGLLGKASEYGSDIVNAVGDAGSWVADKASDVGEYAKKAWDAGSEAVSGVVDSIFS